MNLRRIGAALIIAGVVATSSMPTLAADDGDEMSDAVLKAYKECRAVAAKADSLERQGLHGEEARPILIGGSCGVAGCGLEYLVVQLFSSANVNPQTRSILARVNVSPIGKKTSVELVELKRSHGV